MRSLAEWLLALAVLAGVVWLGGPVVRRVIPPPPGTVTLVESDLPALPTGVPARAVSAPLVILLDGTVVRLGMTEDELRRQPLSRWTAAPPIVEKGIIGDRIILSFRADRTPFWVVLDRIDRERERQVTAIYLR